MNLCTKPDLFLQNKYLIYTHRYSEDFYFTTGDETLLDCPEHEVEDKSSSPCLKGSHNLSDMLEEGPQDIENQLTSSDHFRGLSCHKIKSPQ